MRNKQGDYIGKGTSTGLILCQQGDAKLAKPFFNVIEALHSKQNSGKQPWDEMEDLSRSIGARVSLFAVRAR